MKCHEIEILISDFLENELPLEQKKLFENHISECLSCKKELEETIKLLAGVSAIPADVSPAHDLWPNIESRINSKKTGHDEDTNGHDNKIFPLNKNVRVTHGKYQDRPSARNRYLKYAAITVIAAMLIIALLPSLLTDRNAVKMDIFKTSWPVINIKGITTIGSKLIYGNDSLKIGDWLETKDSAQAKLEIPGIGSILIEPNSRVSIVRSDSNEYRLALDYGTINADITAKPRTFFVDTKSATAIDYGCEYTLSVEPSGDGILYVKEGMVALESNGRHSLVPAGKFCMSKAGIGPGTPYRKNSTEEFKQALVKYDFGNGGSESINTMLKYAKKQDAVTLVNMLPRLDDQQRPKVYARVVEFVPPPKNFRHDSIPFLKIEELNQWIEKVQTEVNAEVEKSLKEMEKNLKENFDFQFEHGKNFNSEEFNEKLQEKIEKHMEGLEKLQELYDIPMEKIEKEMENMSKQMENFNYNFNYNYNYDSSKIQREMDKVQRKLEKSQRKMEEKMRQHERYLEQKERETEQFERQQEQLQREQEQREREQEQIEREQELRQRDIERQQELEERQREREHELEERQKEREKEFEERNKEREERLKEKMKEKEKNNNDGDDGG